MEARRRWPSNAGLLWISLPRSAGRSAFGLPGDLVCRELAARRLPPTARWPRTTAKLFRFLPPRPPEMPRTRTGDPSGWLRRINSWIAAGNCASASSFQHSESFSNIANAARKLACQPAANPARQQRLKSFQSASVRQSFASSNSAIPRDNAVLAPAANFRHGVSSGNTHAKVQGNSPMRELLGKGVIGQFDVGRCRKMMQLPD